MRISDWSSDVCSSDLPEAVEVAVVEVEQRIERRIASSHRSADPIVAWEVAAAFDRAIGGEAHLVSQLRDDVVDAGQDVAAVMRSAGVGPVVEAAAGIVASAEERLPRLDVQVARVGARPVPVGQHGPRVERSKVLFESQ